MVNALDQKLLQDLWRMRGQALAIAFVLAAAAATFVLSKGVYHSLVETRDEYYAGNNFADIFAEMTRAPCSVVGRVEQLPGVRTAEGSILQYGMLDFPGHNEPMRALFASIEETGRMRLNRVVLRRGRLPRAGETSEVVADEAFAKANGLELGRTFDAVIYGTRQHLKVVGIGLAPNYIYALAPGEILPDNTRFGIFWMGRGALEAITDRTEAINSLAIALERGASAPDVIRKIDIVLEPYGGTGAYTREDHPSHAFLDNELVQLNAMTTVVPPVFLLTSTFLVYIVLGRMVRTERAQIGLLKAFGYSDAAVGWHYLKFALGIALLATLLGSIAGVWMGRQMTALYTDYFRFPFLSYRVSPGVIGTAAGLSLIAAGVGALAGVRSAISLAPAVAMSPPPPPVYRAGMAERMGRAAGFTAVGHMIVRHIARWPGRSAVTVLGVALSAGLLFATLQFLDASRAMLDTYFLRSQRQNLTVTFVEPRSEAVLRELRQMPGVLRVEGVRALPVRISHGNRSERTAIESVGANSVLNVRIDSNGSEIALPPSGLMISRQLAGQLAARSGDMVGVEVLGGRRTEATVRVASVVDEFVGARAYAVQQTVEHLSRDASPVGAALLRIDPAAHDSILVRLKEMPVVLGVTERDAAFRLFEAMIDENINTMLFFYILFASAIAIGVVYNSARILFSERAHELATLRVLGYFQSEVGTVLVGELALLIAAAVLPGCIIGYWLAQLMMEMFSSDLFRLPFAPERSTYGLSMAIVMAAALVTSFLVALRVVRLDMVGVLKARD